jgi:signal peptide peptidase SppA
MDLRASLEKLIGRTPTPSVAVLRLQGPIGVGGRRGLSIERLALPLERAFSMTGISAVALVINSPGGSPAQSALIGARIRALAEEKKLPVYAYVEDVAASGGYWLACAADEIVADANSIVGSIGVIAASFGFEDLMRRLGVQRRLYTAGSRKSMLDPFGPEKEEDVARLRALQDEIHANFRDWVSARRGARLTADREILFTGEFWTGTKAKALGLVDALGDARSDLRRRFGEKVRFRGVPVQGRSLRSLLGLSTPDAGWPDELVDSLETRALYARYGL